MAELTVSDDLEVHIGRSRAALTPAQAFATAEQLIRAATRAIVLDAADSAMVRAVASDPAAYLRDVGE